MNLDQLKLFRDIAVTQSISRAASMSGVSQSAASQSIQEIERELGVTLLDRSVRPLAITKAGVLYLDFCREVLRRRETFDAELGALKQDMGGVVRVVSIYSMGLSEMTELEREFARRRPGGKLVVEYLQPANVYQAILTDAADIGLVSYPEARRDITVIPWRQEEMLVAASPYHPVASLTEVSATDLSGVEFIGFDPHLPIQQAIERFFAENNSRLNVTMHFDNLQTVKEAVERRLGISILPARLIQTEVAQGRLASIPIAGGNLFRPVGIIHRKRKTFNAAAQEFLSMLKELPTQVVVGIE